MERRRNLFSSLFVAAVLLAAVPSVRAHGDSVSTVHLTLGPTEVRAAITLHFRDLSQWVPPGPPDYPAAVADAMRSARDSLLALSYDDAAVPPNRFAVTLPAPGTVLINLDYPAPPPGAASLEVRSLHVDRLPLGHHQVLSIEDARRSESGILIAEETLGTEQDSASIDIPKAASGRLRMIPAVAAASPAAALAPGAPPRTKPHWAAVAALLGFTCVVAYLVLKPHFIDKGRST